MDKLEIVEKYQSNNKTRQKITEICKISTIYGAIWRHCAMGKTFS